MATNQLVNSFATKGNQPINQLTIQPLNFFATKARRHKGKSTNQPTKPKSLSLRHV